MTLGIDATGSLYLKFSNYPMLCITLLDVPINPIGCPY